MKLRKVSKFAGAGLGALCLLFSNGCGGSGGGANVVTILVTPSLATLILGQSQILTATVSGTSNTNVTWSPCQYTTTTTTNGKATTSNPTNCPADGSFGVLSNQEATGTATYTAPDPAKFQLPDQTKFPGLQIVITATSVQDTKKSAKANIALISGIRTVLTPPTASLPTKESQLFFVSLTNDLQNKGVTWLLTQNVPSTTNGVTTTYPQLPTCSPTCGTITPQANNPNVAIYTAPDTVPTAITPAQKDNPNSSSPQNVTVVATPVADNSAFVIGTITIIQGGPITFNGITPTIAPQGATLWDIYLDAPNISSSSIITLTDSVGGTTVIKSDSGQIKVLFPVPAPSSSTSSTSTTTTCSATSPCSTGARLRLFANNLANAGPVTVSVSDPAEPVTQCTGNPLPQGCTTAGTFTYNIIPVRATSTATVPDDIVQGGQTLDFPVTIDGGYFGPNGNSAAVFFQSPGNTLTVDPTLSDSRQLATFLPANHINPSNPGLYPLYVRSNGSPAPNPGNPSVTNMALFPDYSVTPPALTSGTSGIAAGTNPSAVDIDPTLGVLVVAETGSNTVEFFSIGNNSLTSLGVVSSTTGAPLNVPTGVSVNRNNHTVAIVNYGSQTVTTNTDGSCKQATATGQSVTVLPIPGSPSPITPFSVPLPFDPAAVPNGALQGSAVCPAPMPYSIGVDPDSNLALVAYSSVSSSSAINLGFIVNLNPNSGTNIYGCALSDAIAGVSPSAGPVGQCLFAQVTLNTNIYPQIAMSTHGHLALVTPGGPGSLGAVRGVDITKPSTANVILSSTLAAGLVTVTVDTTKCPPGVQGTGTSTNPCPLLMVPGNAGSVFITGVVPANDPADSALFNGVFTVNVISSNSFTYTVNNATASDTGGPSTTAGAPPPTVFYGSPDQIFGLPASSQGVAINPVTSTAAIADANSLGTNGPQINLLSGLDQSVSSITFFAGCTAFTTLCSSTAELLATTNVAWQPFTNEVVSYNPKQGFVSVSDPVSRKRYAIVNGLGPGAIAFPVSNGTSSSGGTPTLTLWGGVAVDPATNQAFVVESGQAATSTTPASPGQIQIIDLGGPNTATPIKPTHVSEVIVPSSAPGSIGGLPNALVPQAALACVVTPPAPANSCDLPGVKIFGAGFAAGMEVRLDGVDITSQGGTIDNIAANGREVDVTIPGFFLTMPHHYALDVLSSGAQSNVLDFIVIQTLDLSKVCTDANNNPVNTQPSSVALADQIANGPFSPFALVSVTGCNSIVAIDLNPTVSVSGQTMQNPNFGHFLGGPISVGTNPQGIAIWQHRGLAVVANHGSATASIIDLTQSPPVAKVPDVPTGTNSTGVAVNEATGAAVVANTGANSASMINLGLLFPPPATPPTAPPASLTAIPIGGIQQPIAVAIDPDRGTNNQGIAVVTGVLLSPGNPPSGALAVVEIGVATPSLSSTIPSGGVIGTPTGIVFDPAVATGTANPGVFYANSSGANIISEFNPDSGGGPPVSVGINPTSLAINPQTGAILTANSASNTISVVDTLSIPFKTRQTLAIPGSPTFGVAIDPFTNLAVIVDQANMRVLLFPMPN